MDANQVAQRLTDSGDAARLKAQLRQRLEASGWIDDVRRKSAIEAKGGAENVTLDQIMLDVAPSARASIPQDVHQDMLMEIQALVKQFVK